MDDAIREYEKATSCEQTPTSFTTWRRPTGARVTPKRALDLYRNYLAKTPKSPLRAEIEERIKSLQKQIDEANSAKPAPPGPEPTAAPLAPPAGSAMGAAPAEAPATSSPPASPELTPPLPATTPVSAPADQADQAAPATAGTSSGPTVTDVVPPAAQGRGLRVAGIASGAVGVVCIGIGVGLG